MVSCHAIFNLVGELDKVVPFLPYSVTALKALLNSRPLPSTFPLFATIHSPHSQVIDTVIRDALKTVLRHRGFSTVGYPLPLLLTIMFNYKTSCLTVPGLARRYGRIFNSLLSPPRLFHSPLPIAFPFFSDWVWCFSNFNSFILKFAYISIILLLTCK